MRKPMTIEQWKEHLSTYVHSAEPNGSRCGCPLADLAADYERELFDLDPDQDTDEDPDQDDDESADFYAYELAHRYDDFDLDD